MKCAVDSYEFTALPDAISVANVDPNVAAGADNNGQGIFEHKPHFHEWLQPFAAQIYHP